MLGGGDGDVSEEIDGEDRGRQGVAAEAVARFAWRAMGRASESWGRGWCRGGGAGREGVPKREEKLERMEEKVGSDRGKGGYGDGGGRRRRRSWRRRRRRRRRRRGGKGE